MFKKIIIFFATLLVVCIMALSVSIYMGWIELNIGVANWEDPEDISSVESSFHKTIQNFSTSETSKVFNKKVVVFNAWGPSCGPCVKEIPLLNKIAKQFQSDTNIVCIAYTSDLPLEKLHEKMKKSDTKFEFKHVELKKGVRLSLKKVVAEHLPKNNINYKHDVIPYTIIFSNTDSLLYYKGGSISETELDSINKLIDNFLKHNE